MSDTPTLVEASELSSRARLLWGLLIFLGSSCLPYAVSPFLVLQGPNFQVLYDKVLLRGERWVVEGGTGVACPVVQVRVQPQAKAPPAGQQQNGTVMKVSSGMAVQNILNRDDCEWFCNDLKSISLLLCLLKGPLFYQQVSV